MATALKDTCLGIPNYKIAFSFTLPPAPIRVLLINLKIFAGSNIRLRFRQALSFFM